jgi:hypothetical protein
MIPEHREPKGLAPDTEGIATCEPEVRAERARRGSDALLSAMLSAYGIEGAQKPKPMPVAAVQRLAKVCPHCQSPIKPRQLIANIQATVAAYYDLPLQTMTSAQQYSKMAHPRQLAMFLAAELTNKSIAEIGRRFSKDHTTVLYEPLVPHV